MNHVKTFVLVALLGSVFYVETAAADVSDYIPIQGYLTDSETGEPLDGAFDVAFSIYGSSIGGSPLWWETYDNATEKLPVENGYFFVYLGQLGDGVDYAALMDATRLYLGIQVGSEPELSPRIELGSVPYAMEASYASDCTTFDGHAVSEFVRTNATTQIQISPYSMIVASGSLEVLPSTSGARIRSNTNSAYSNTAVILPVTLPSSFSGTPQKIMGLTVCYKNVLWGSIAMFINSTTVNISNKDGTFTEITDATDLTSQTYACKNMDFSSDTDDKTIDGSVNLLFSCTLPENSAFSSVEISSISLDIGPAN